MAMSDQRRNSLGTRIAARVTQQRRSSSALPPIEGAHLCEYVANIALELSQLTKNRFAPLSETLLNNAQLRRPGGRLHAPDIRFPVNAGEQRGHSHRPQSQSRSSAVEGG